MEYNTLGKSSVTVSKLCFGSLTVGPLQAALPIEKGAAVMAYAFKKGITAVDTAQYYQNYDYIRLAMKMAGCYDVVISSKTYAYTKEMAAVAVEEARKALDRDYIDVFMLHEQESIHTLRGHREALDYLYEMKARGIIKAVGASMHHIAAVNGAREMGLDVIHPIFNLKGLGIVDGTSDEMREAMIKAKNDGIGIYSMKPLGGGHLFSEADKAFDYVLDSGAVDAVAVGMQSPEEVDCNITYFEKREYTELSREKRRLHIEDYCVGCGKCCERCGQKALSLHDGHAVCDTEKCVLCGYCSQACEIFAIKVL